MTNTNKDPQQPDEQETLSGSHEAQRRRLLRAGVTSSLLLTIASRPTWAQNAIGGSAVGSANGSGNLDVDGLSISAVWWKNFKHRWPISSSTPFHSIFTTVQYKGQVLYNGHSLGDVIDLNGGRDPVKGTFGFHLIGAYLNALAFPPDQGKPGFAFTAQQVVDAFNALYGMDTSTPDEGGGKPGRGRFMQVNAAPSPADASFDALASTFEAANNQYDGVTPKPESW